MLWPHQGKVFTISQPAFFGEIALMLWLLIKGAKPQVPDPPRRSRRRCIYNHETGWALECHRESTVRSSHAGVHGAGF
jgi:hypothetical protein